MIESKVIALYQLSKQAEASLSATKGVNLIMLPSSDTIRWLLDGDPSVAWQAQRDLLGRSPRTWQATRRVCQRQGWVARLMSHRAPDGTFGGGLYGPKWTSTFYTLRLLTQLGVPPTNRDALASCRLLLDEGVTASGGASLWSGAWVDTCVTGMLLSMACYFELAGDPRCKRMASWLLAEQMNDGGWNCNKTREMGARHGSFHTTISTLEGLSAFAAHHGDAELDRATALGRDFFLRHQLYRSCRSGEIVRPSFTRFSFPPRWYFDVLRGLEYFWRIDAPWDHRLADPVELLQARQGTDGRWKAQNKHTGRTFFELEPARKSSRMNTLRALRVLGWVERAKREH